MNTQEEAVVFATEFEQKFVPLDQMGKAHWSTLAYVETIVMETGGDGFQVGYDAHMRMMRRNFRIMLKECRNPRRISRVTGPFPGHEPVSREQGSRLKDGRIVPSHDDYSCLQDFAALGYFIAVVPPKRTKYTVIGANDVQPGVCLHFSPKGRAVIGQLRDFKAKGGNYGDFMPSQEYR